MRSIPSFVTTLRKAVLGHVRRALLSGLLLLAPIALTYVIIRFLFDLIDGVLRPWLVWIFEQFGIGWDLPGPGILAAAVILYLTGVILAHRFGRGLVEGGRAYLLRIPFVGTVYSANRQLIESFAGTSTTGFKRVVLARFPRDATWSLGFLTGLTDAENVDRLAMVYIPTAPLPNSGFVVMMPFEDVMDTDLSVSEAMQLIFSGGIVSPRNISSRPIDISEAERQMARVRSPSGPLVDNVREGLLATVLGAGKATRVSTERVRRISADAIRRARSPGMESGMVARDAVAGTIHALDQSDRHTVTDVRDAVSGVIHGVRDATGITTQIIQQSVEGAIHGSQATGKQDEAVQGAVEGAMRAAPSVGVTLDDAIYQVSRGATEALKVTGSDLAEGARASIRGIILGTSETGDPLASATLSAREMVFRIAAIEKANLGAVARAVVQGAAQAASGLSTGAGEMADAATRGALEGASLAGASAEDSVRVALAEPVNGLRMSPRIFDIGDHGEA